MTPPPGFDEERSARAAAGLGHGVVVAAIELHPVGVEILRLEEGVERVRVAVRKPHVALGGPLDFAEIVVEYRA